MILECGHCGAPLDVKENARLTKCRYCGVTSERQRLRTIAAATPRDFHPPKVWVPPASAEADSNVPLEYKKQKGSPGCAIAVVLVLLTGAAIGGYKLLHYAAFSPKDLARTTLDGPYQAWCKERPTGHEMTDWCVVKLKTERYDFVNVTWKPSHPDHASGFHLATNSGSKDDGLGERISRALPGGLDSNGTWSWPGVNVNVSPTGGMNATVDPEKSPTWKRQIDALWRIFLHAAFGAGTLPAPPELRELLGGGYPFGDLAKVSPKTPIDQAPAAVRAIFPAAAVEQEGGVEIRIGLDHPLFRQVALKWPNQRGATLNDVAFLPTPAYEGKRKALATCLAGRLRVSPKVQETDYLKKKENYHFVLGKLWLYVSEDRTYFGGHDDTVDTTQWKEIVSAFDACRG